MSTQETTRDLAKQIAAANALREALRAVTDDSETIRDTIEGETSLHDAIGAVMAEIREDEILAAGIEAMLKTLGERKARLETRIEYRRAAVLQAMTIGEIQKLTLPDATISVRNIPPGLQVVDEAKIPAQFWKPSDPKLDKAALKAALKDGILIEGASLDNGGISLAIRRA